MAGPHSSVPITTAAPIVSESAFWSLEMAHTMGAAGRALYRESISSDALESNPKSGAAERRHTRPGPASLRATRMRGLSSDSNDRLVLTSDDPNEKRAATTSDLIMLSKHWSTTRGSGAAFVE
eukprot:CAMPEP_0172040176 /NCGR_PEP_ID=MMETSP1041-20130122/24342_1 /TAXON_ID=464988 /ORGANISM="Hemiselmis andersenii, Strain CCMP439" /LENGTH=122 /DNA_ID=CAMNT_0012698023 /DNA_START=89 /DNA_END=457 /DNA_ORIENTATION=+